MKRTFYYFFVPIILLLTGEKSFSQITIPSGSYIIDMGASPATKPDGVRPYGMIHELVKFYNAQIYWVIRDNKTKDAVDYTIEGNAYKGGLFIIPGNLIDNTLETAITGWTTGTHASPNGYTRGLVTARKTTQSYTFTGALYDLLKSVPTWTLDAQNGGIAQGFFTNAGIPSTAYNWLLPSQLGNCSDIFVMPHADPRWATHGNLLDWNLTYKGAIWLACHAGSALENMYNPADVNQQTNFLSTKATSAGTGITLPVPGSTAYAQNSLVLWGAHTTASIPYSTNTPITAPQTGTYAEADDWVSQFIGTTDLAHLNGSEQVYLPVLGQQWRPTTKIISYDPTQANVPANSPGAAVIMAYGRGFGDDNRGYVMLEAGHTINKGTTGDIPAQRAFFNWSLLASKTKAVDVGSITGAPVSGRISGPISLSVTATSPVATSGSLSYTWACKLRSNGASFGSFSVNNSTSASTTTFTPSSVLDVTEVVFSVAVTDPCGRTTLSSYQASIVPGARTPVANPDVASISATCYSPGISTTVSVLQNDTDADNDLNTSSVLLIDPTNASNTGTSYTVAGTGTWTTNGTTVTFAPAANFFGSASISYKVCDQTSPTPLCATSTVSVGVGAADVNGCYPGTIWDVASETLTTTQTNTSITNPANAVGAPDFDPADNTTYAVINSNSDILTLDFGSLISTSTSKRLAVYFASGTQGTSTTIKVDYSTDGSSFTQLGTQATSDNDPATELRFSIPSGGVRYIRITRSAGTADLWIDAVTVENLACISSALTATDDDELVQEEIPMLISPLDNDVNPGNQAIKLTIVTLPTKGSVSINTDNTITYVNNYDVSGTDQFVYKICNNDGSCSTATVRLTIVDDGCSAGQYKPLSSTTSTVTFSTTAQSEDAHVNQKSATNNYNTSATLEIGKAPNNSLRMLWKPTNFTTTVPANAVIQSANFRLTQTNNQRTAFDISLSIYPLTQSWVEGQTTWTVRSTGNNWTSAGGTFNNTAYATQTVNASTAGTQNTFNITALIEYWQANRGVTSPRPDEMGFLVKQTIETTVNKSVKFGSSENTTSGYAPLLTVTYKTPDPCITTPNRNPLAMPDEVSGTTSNAVTISTALSNDGDVDPSSSLSITAVSMVNSARGSVSRSGNTITYTPNNSIAVPRVDTLLYTISDGTLTDQAYIFVTVSNAAPTLQDDAVSGNSNTAMSRNVATNDSDPEGGALSNPTVTVQPQNGSYTISGTTITYTPNFGFYGTDQLTYQRCETTTGGCSSSPLCSTAILTFTVSNQAPTASNKTAQTLACQSVTINLLNNVSDPEGETLTFNITSGSTVGNVTTFANGSTLTKVDYGIYTYTAPSAIGSQTINYTVTDPGGLTSSSASITITIADPNTNQAPVALNDPYNLNTFENVGYVGDDIYVDVVANDSDPDNNPLEIQLTPVSGLTPQSPGSGAVSLFNGLLLYTPAPGFTGTDNFQYIVKDVQAAPSGGGCSTPTIKYSMATASVLLLSSLQNLPLNWISFTVKHQQDGSALLTWKTANEVNTKDFIIEKGTKPSNMMPIGTVEAAGSGNNNYQFIDKNPGANTVFYRIKQRDLDMNFSYSPTRYVRLSDGKPLINVYPNPTRQLTNISLLGKSNDKFLIQVFTTSGNKVFSEISGGNKTFPLNMSKYANGAYMIQVIDLQTGSNQTVSLIKQ